MKGTLLFGDGEYNLVDRAMEHNLKSSQEITKLRQKLQTEQSKHECTLNVLRDTLTRLKKEGNTKTLVDDIEQYLDDVKGV